MDDLPSELRQVQDLPIHGGPQTASLDAWSTRWNYKVFADQGYVVVAPNPTGSSGFGEKLTDMIQNNWGISCSSGSMVPSLTIYR